LALDDFALVGSSPEVLVRVEGGEVTVRPIAGTRPRGGTPQEDEALGRALLADEKERAEHLMLVDLGRNDVGRVAQFATVRVTDLLTLERYSHVQHIVSEVRGRLRDGYDALDVFKACFPAGTVTGAPKVRAMAIIDELEPERRGPYAGAVGYVGWGATNLDTAIAIRAAVVLKDRVVVQAGAGIVADSDPARELAETEATEAGVVEELARARRAAEGDGGDVNVTARDGRLAAITVVAFRRDMADVTAWARSRFGAPAGACTGDRGPMEWWAAGNRIVTVTRPVAGARSRELVIRPGRACPG